MLRKLSDEVRYAEQRAVDAAEKAARTTDVQLKADYLTIERSWSKLARSYELAERIGAFISHNARKAAALPMRIPVVQCPACGAPMRIVSVFPHGKYKNLDERTFDCTCGKIVVLGIAKSVDGL